MQSQEQNQQPDDLEPTEQGQGSSGLENSGASEENIDDKQNDLAGNASGNTPDQPAGNIPSEIGGTDISGEDSADQIDSLPSDGPVSPDEGGNKVDLNNIETDDDDESEIKD